MVNLLRAELLRLVSNRKALVLAVLVLLLGFWTACSLVDVLRPYTVLDWDEAQRQANDVQINLEVACGVDGAGIGCSSLPTSVAVEGFLRPRLSFEQFGIVSLGPTTWMGLFFVVVLVAAMIGSEFNTGSISTQLTFTPRRLQLLWAKVAASAICGACLMALWAVAMVVLDVFVFLNMRGVDGLTAGPLLASQIGRALLAGFVLAAMTAMVTMTLASTIKTWLLIFASLTLSQLLESSENLGQAVVLLPTTNVFGLIDGEWSRAYNNGNASLGDTLPQLDYGYSLAYTALWMVVFGIWSSVSFSRRNIIK